MTQIILNAIAETNRFRMVEYLKDGPRTVGEISDYLQIRQPQTSKHLRVLHNARIVEVYADANRRIYKLQPETFQSLDEWVTSYRHLWEERFDRLDDHLSIIQKNKEGEN